MKYVLALMVFVLGLEGVDRALLERGMEAMKPPRVTHAWHELLDPEPVPAPPPPPPPTVSEPFL